MKVKNIMPKTITLKDGQKVGFGEVVEVADTPEVRSLVNLGYLIAADQEVDMKEKSSKRRR